MRLSSLIHTDDSDHVSFCHNGHTYRIGECIGKGGFGSVFSVLGKPQLVIKKIPIKSNHHYQLIQKELELTRVRLNHPFILRSFEFHYDSSNKTAYILYERIQGNSLYTHIQHWRSNPPPLPNAWLAYQWHIASQICCGLHYLHTQGFTHRDIKPHNIMVQNSPLHAKLIDFGLSQRSHKTTGRSGSKLYNAPETLDTTYPQTHAVDLWSLGCLLFHLFFYKTIFHHSKTKAFDKKEVAIIPTIHRRIMQHTDTLLTPSEPDVARVLPLIRNLLQLDPNQRPSAHEAYYYLKNNQPSGILYDVFSSDSLHQFQSNSTAEYYSNKH